MNPVIYLFNSAFRPKYAKNVLNTLYLPAEYANEYRYRCGQKEPNVSQAFMSKLKTFGPGTECVFVFIDRYSAGGYTYHPLRTAKLIGFREDAGYLYAKAKLQSFIYPRDLQQFQKDLLQQLRNLGLPTLTNDDPEYRHDGNYILDSENIFGKLDNFYGGDEAWQVAVDNLSGTKTLASTASRFPIFLKGIVRQGDKGSQVDPKSDTKKSSFVFTRDRRYELVLTYRFPAQASSSTAQIDLEVSLGDILRGQGNTSFDVDALSNSVTIPFTTKRYADDHSNAIILKQSDPKDAEEVLLPDASLEYSIHEGGTFWIQIVLLLLLYAVASAILNVDLSKIQPLTGYALAHAIWPKLISGAVQAISVFFLVRILGRKPL